VPSWRSTDRSTFALLARETSIENDFTHIERRASSLANLDDVVVGPACVAEGTRFGKRELVEHLPLLTVSRAKAATPTDAR
jgi:hypothetical protein